MTAKMTMEMLPKTADVSIGPQPRAWYAAGANPVSILQDGEIDENGNSQYTKE